MCVYVVGAQSSTSTDQKIMIGPVHIIFGAEWRKQHLTCVLEVGGGGEWRQSPPVSRAKQLHGNGLMLWADEWQPVCQPSGRGVKSQQRPAWHSRLGEQIPLLQLFSQGSCWHSHFGAPAKDSMAYLRTEQQCSIPENDICTGRSVHFFFGLKMHMFLVVRAGAVIKTTEAFLLLVSY